MIELIERARSLSPTKDSPMLDTARFSVSSISSRPIDPPEHLEPTTTTPTTAELETPKTPDSASRNRDSIRTGGGGFGSPRGSEYGMDTSPTRQTPTFGRRGTLSWQQRPLSREFGGRSLFSTSPTRANHLRSRSTVTSDSQGQEPSRDQNISTMAANDATPAPRQQPTDQEVDSLAPQKSSAPESSVDSIGNDHETSATGLETIVEPEKSSGHQQNFLDDERSRSPSRASSTFGDSSLGNRYSSVSSVSTATGLGSPLPQSNAQRFEPRKAEPELEDQMPPSPTRRMSPERPSSPTKGLGGFVQSAMMKRSDTVSKRWSAQVPSGLSRTNSVTSNRNSVAIPSQDETSSVSNDKLDEDIVPAPPSHRPSSSHSEATIVHNNAKENPRPETPPVPSYVDTKGGESPSKSSLSLHSRSGSTFDKDNNQSTEHSSAGSPAHSRTMDPKRWSPTKASWLESALNRPDSPRHRKQASQSSTWSKDRQPRGSIDLTAWAKDRQDRQSKGSVDLSSWSKDRQSKGSVELGRKNSFKEVTPTGLMRSMPPGSHFKKPSITGIPDLSSGLDTGKGREQSSPEPVSNPKETEPLTVDTSAVPRDEIKEEVEDEAKEDDTHDTPSVSPEKSPQQTTTAEVKTDTTSTSEEQTSHHKPSPLSLAPTPTIPPSPLSPRDPASPKPKAQSPVIDFRANLRRREVVKDDAPKEEPEFKNVFGKLKKTATSNYVAPDKLKDNILKGKASLSTTGGPQKSAKQDEFKESLVKQKEAIKTTGGLSRRNTIEEKDAPSSSLPEAIAKRNSLAMPSSVKGSLSANSPDSPLQVSSELSTPDLLGQKSPSSSPQRSETVENTESSQTTSVPDESATPAEPEFLSSTVYLASSRDETSSEFNPDSVEDQLRNEEPEPAQERKSNEEKTQPVRALPSESVTAASSVPVAPSAAPEGSTAKGNKLAGRINPALAGLLSRGPPPVGAAGNGAKKPMPMGLGITGSGGAESSGAPLTHMTKNRVRGPRRRGPGAAATGQTEQSTLNEPDPKPEQSSSFLGLPEVSGTKPAPEVPVSRGGSPDYPEETKESEPSSSQADLSPPRDEPIVTETELPADKDGEELAQHELPAPKDEVFDFSHATFEESVSKEEESREESASSESSFLKDEPQSEVPAIKEEPLLEEESTVVESEATALRIEALSQPEPPASEPEVPASEPESHVSEDEPVTQSEPFDFQTESSRQESEEPVSEPEPAEQLKQPANDDSAPSERSPSLESTREESPVGDSNSNWPLPDIEPITINKARSEQAPASPSTTRNLTGNSMEFRTLQETTGNETKPPQGKPQGNVTPQTKKRLSALSPSTFHSYEDVENIGDSPAQKPPVQPRQSPRTPSSDQRWSARTRISSQSPSPLRTSYKEDSVEPPVDSPQQRSFAAFLRSKALSSPPVAPKRTGTDFSSPRSSSSLVPLADESMEVISEFFKSFPKQSDRVDIDPQLMLTSQSDDLKIRTVKKQVWEITSDGKRQDLPVNQEYILYQGSMYLCIHTFESNGATRSEAHLWCGDDVPDNAVDDGQSFSRKMAKENGCKLEVIKQGKETARLIHALGGILIIRRGFNSRSSLSALYMLCGRKHLNQMVFDEIDFSRRNLCSGFPFVISAPFGKLYLWKGKGSTAEEIGAARLIGMDLGLTGEFEEVMEGEEPESFFEIFRDTGKYMQASYWQLKPNHEHFRCRLLRVDHELGQRSGFWIRRPGSSSPVIRPNDTVQEVEPYCLKDIAAKGIYILDIYFEIYV